MSKKLPLDGVRVVEFVHMVMGPTCGLVLADLGAEVIKVEPLEGDHTRKLTASGAGFFPTYNRNKKSLAVDLKSPAGREIVLKLIKSADVVSENFRPGAMDKLGFGYDAVKTIKPDIIYCSHKGFLPGPYEHRTALDEVVQMMSGLAYMTGPVGKPLRAGAPVNDMMGGMFGAIAILGALIQRGISGRGMEVQSALFENNVFLVGQHMLQYAITGQPAAPMPARISPWAIYDVFTVKDGEQIFLAAVSDAQWVTFCDALGFDDLKADQALKLNNDRVHARPTLLLELGRRLKDFSAAELSRRFEAAGLPFAPIMKPEQLLDDPHLVATGGLADITLTDGARAGAPVKATLFPFTLDGQRPGVRLNPPKRGEHTREVLAAIGIAPREIDALIEARAVACPAFPPETTQ